MQFKTQLMEQVVLDLSPEEAKHVKIPTGLNPKTKFSILRMESMVPNSYR